MKFQITSGSALNESANGGTIKEVRKQLAAINDWLNKRVAAGAIDSEYLKTINRQLADIIETLS